MTSLKPASVQANPNVLNTDVLSITMPMINRMKIEDKSNQTIKSYVRAVERLVRFHDMIHPKELDIDEVLDFLVSLNEHDQVNWRTSKMYVAGLRYYWAHPSTSSGQVCLKMMNLQIGFLILKNILAYPKSSVVKNWLYSLLHVIMINIG